MCVLICRLKEPEFSQAFLSSYAIVSLEPTAQVMLVVKNLPAHAGNTRDVGLIPESRRSPGGGNGNLIQYSCQENPMDRGSWWATVAKSLTWPSNWAHVIAIHSIVGQIPSISTTYGFSVGEVMLLFHPVRMYEAVGSCKWHYQLFLYWLCFCWQHPRSRMKGPFQ